MLKKRVAILLSVIAIFFWNISQSKAESIQEEIEKIEEKSIEYEEIISNTETQSNLNINSSELANLWDAELNFLWKRLVKELNAEQKKKLLAQQRAWIKRKEADIKATGAEYEGGSIQPLIYNSRTAELTRARVYVLAKYLAHARKEPFIISNKIKESINEADPSLDDIFKSFEGCWEIYEETNKYIGIERTDMSLYGVDGSNWTLWITDGVVLSDLNVYSYTKESVIFKVSNNGKDSFYRLGINIDNSLIFESGNSLDEMENPIFSYDFKERK